MDIGYIVPPMKKNILINYLLIYYNKFKKIIIIIRNIFINIKDEKIIIIPINVPTTALYGSSFDLG